MADRRSETIENPFGVTWFVRVAVPILLSALLSLIVSYAATKERVSVVETRQNALEADTEKNFAEIQRMIESEVRHNQELRAEIKQSLVELREDLRVLLSRQKQQ